MASIRPTLVLTVLMAATVACAPAATPSPSGPTPTPLATPDPGLATGDPDERHVTPVPGQQNVLPVPIDELTAVIEGRSVAVIARWTSGVEPCFVLDSVTVDPIPDGFAVGLREGTSRPGVACDAIAVTKSTLIEIGDVEPGTYRIRDAAGSGTMIEIVVR